MISSDEDIMQATVSTLQIFKTYSFSSEDSSENENDFSRDSVFENENDFSRDSVFENENDFSRDSVFESPKSSDRLSDDISPDGILSISCESLSDNVLDNSELFDFEENITDLEVQKILEKIEIFNEMYANLELLWQSKEKADVETCLTDFCANTIQPSNISKTVEKMKSVIRHIQAITTERCKLKQVLRSNVLNDVWQISKDSHKTVIHFFTLASELVKNIDTLITALESRKDFNPDNLKILQKRERKFLLLLQENMDTIEEFCSFVQQYTYL